MRNENEWSRWGLKRGWGYRIGLCLIALPIFIVSMACLINLPWILRRPIDALDFVVQLLVVEFVIAVVVVSALALVWAVATPDWVERWINHHAWVVTIGIYLFIPSSLAVMHCLLR
jgi:hypothetical protein